MSALRIPFEAAGSSPPDGLRPAPTTDKVVKNTLHEQCG
jgi:hypothetical protein